MNVKQNEAFAHHFLELQKQIHGDMVANGFWDQCYIQADKGHGNVDQEFDPGLRNTGEAIALMHSELSEALEADRKNILQSEHIPTFTGLEEELADVIIRIMDYAQANELRIPEAILAKCEFNRTRPHKHGKKF